MTRNTKRYKAKIDGKSYIFRDLTVLELSVLGNIKNTDTRLEEAGRMSTDGQDIQWQVLQQIGAEAIQNSSMCVSEPELFELTVKEYRNKVKNDSVLNMISQIIRVLPSVSPFELLNKTHKDLIELIALCEEITGKAIFKVGRVPTKGMKLADPDQAKSMQDKMADLNSHLGYK